MLSGKVLITGGCGTLGKAIIQRATEEDWPCEITVFSTDAVKHAKVKNMFPDVHSVIGDIRNFDTLHAVMSGKDIVIHAAAVKFIPVSEYNSIDTIDININGSLNVCRSAMQHGTPHVLGISTDKACHPANLYGATKMAMEKIFQEFSRQGLNTSFHLVRYGNVLESTGSVVEVWRNADRDHKPLQITDGSMTRFWISPKQAVQYVLDALKFESGNIYIPKMKSLSIGQMAEWIAPGAEFTTVPLRPGEKMHETLLTEEEVWDAKDMEKFYVLFPSTTEGKGYFSSPFPYTSENSPRLTRDELFALLDND